MRITRRERSRFCSNKITYKRRQDAEMAARQYEQDIVLSEMNAYWCIRHQGWHKGHPNKRRYKNKVMSDAESWFDFYAARSRRAA